jgi:hypothetical protein
MALRASEDDGRSEDKVEKDEEKGMGRRGGGGHGMVEANGINLGGCGGGKRLLTAQQLTPQYRLASLAASEVPVVVVVMVVPLEMVWGRKLFSLTSVNNSEVSIAVLVEMVAIVVIVEVVVVVAWYGCGVVEVCGSFLITRFKTPCSRGGGGNGGVSRTNTAFAADQLRGFKGR